MKIKALTCIILFVFLFSLISCPTPVPGTPPPVFNQIYTVDVISSSMEYTLDSTGYSTSIEKAVYWPDTENPQMFRVNILFTGFPLILILRCNWENGVFGIQGDAQSGKLGFDVRHPFFEHPVYLHNFNTTYDFSVETTEDRMPSALSFTMVTPPNLAAVDEIKYPEWAGKEAEISSLQFNLTFTPVGEICVNYTTTENLDDLRQWDTSSIIDNVPGGIDVFNNPEEYLDDLVDYLVSSTVDPVKRVKIIHDWIADNIYYFGDYYQAVLDGLPLPRVLKAPCEILAEKKAECGGHSCFFRTLCRMADVRIEYVWNYTKSAGYQATGELESHVCNMMKINGQVYYMDVTFDNNNYNLGGDLTTKPFKSGYLFMTPDWFKYVHLPRNPIFQTWVAANPQQFLKDANMRWRGITSTTKEFHELGYSFASPVPEAIVINGSAGTVTCNESGAVYNLYSASYGDDGTQQNYWNFMEKSGSQYTLKISPDWAGIGYSVIGFFDSEEVWNELSRVRWNSVSAPVTGYPLYFRKFIESEAHLISPIARTLKRGQEYSFQIEVPVAYGVRLYNYDGTTYTNLASFTNTSGTLWEVTHTVSNPDRLMLLIRLEPAGNYLTSLEYALTD
ncbi:MAG: hypothetical protein JW969_02165 [Spirochaetales bacterium]|nr:hypothetical protein [Spirochaetales bacterium]